MKGGFIVQKKEMTRIPVGEKLLPVTLLQVIPQDVVRYKTKEKDWYVAVVVGARKKTKTTKTGEKNIYNIEKEFVVDESYIAVHEAGKALSIDELQNIQKVSIVGTAKGKWFQGVMKRHHADGWPETHGSKFHRTIGSMGNRKPRRVQKGHPHAGHMWTQQVSLHEIEVVGIIPGVEENLMIVRGSVPGAYNNVLYVTL